MIDLWKRSITEYVESTTKTNQYIDMMEQNPSEFKLPLLTMNGIKLPTMFLRDPALFGIVDDADHQNKELVPYKDRLSTLADTVRVDLSSDSKSSLPIVEKNGKTNVRNLSSSLKSVTNAFEDTVLTKAERYFGAYMDGVSDSLTKSGMILQEDVLARSVDAVLDQGKIGQMPRHPPEDVRSLACTMKREYDDRKSAALARVRAAEQRLDDARTEAHNAVMSALKKYMQEANKVSELQLEASKQIMVDRLEFDRRLTEATRSADLPSHRQPMDVWMQRNKIKDSTCALSCVDVPTNVDRSALYVTEIPLDGSYRRMFYYAKGIEEIIHRKLYGQVLHGKVPPRCKYTEDIRQPENSGIYRWKEVINPISRRPEDNITAIHVADSKDVHAITNDTQVFPWWQMANYLSLHDCHPTRFRDKRKFSALLDQFRGALGDIQVAQLLSKFDNLETKAHNVRSLPPQFYDSCVLRLYGESVTFDEKFQTFYSTLTELVDMFWSMIVSHRGFANPRIVCH
jgi:hypothetical protein